MKDHLLVGIIGFAVLANSAPISIAGELGISQQEEPADRFQSQSSAGARPTNLRATEAPSSDEIEKDASKCRLAHAILSGAARHSNGAPTDAYDLQVAENDIRKFCDK